MAKPSIKEIKGILNFGFYPDHYLTTALGADAKAHGFSGDTFKALRKTLMSSVESLCEKPSEGLIQEAAESIFKALGFYEVRGVGDNSLKLVLDGREFSCPTERIVPFIGDKGLLALFIDKSAVASGDEASSRDKAIEHFYQGDSPLKMRDRASYYSWRDVITAAFNSDYSTAENIIVCSGKQIHLLERGKWQESEAYMTFDLGTLFAVNADDGYQITESLLAAKAFPIASAESFHDVVGRNAHKKAAEVTKALRDTLRDSIEILANQILDTHRRKTIKELSQFDFENQVDRDAAAKVIFDQSL
ncbi:MAG: hypothetical protein RIQ81_150, partial [Pseudomonadota bacterium]